MDVSVIVERVSENVIRATSHFFGMQAEAATQAEATKKLRAAIEKRMQTNGEIVRMDVDVFEPKTSKEGRSAEILFLIPTNLTRPFFTNILQKCELELERVLGDSGRTILRYVPRDDEEFRTDEVTRLLWREFRASRRIRLLIVAPTGSRRLAQEIARTIGQVDKSIPVIALTLPFRNADAFQKCGVSHPAYLVCNSERGTIELGKAAAAGFGSQAKTAKVVLIRGAGGRADSNARIRGFLSGLKASGLSYRIEKLDKRYCNWRRDEARLAFLDVVYGRQAKIDIAFAANDEMSLGVREAISELNSSGSRHLVSNCRVYGFDAIPEVMSYLNTADEHLRGTVEQPVAEMANKLAYLAQEIINGKYSSDAQQSGESLGVYVQPIVHLAQAPVTKSGPDSPPPAYDGSDRWSLAADAPRSFGKTSSLRKYAQAARTGKDEHGEYGVHGVRKIRKLRIVDGKTYWWLGEGDPKFDMNSRE